MHARLMGALAIALATAPLQAQTIYKCQTPHGVVYSQRPCAPDAEKREMQPTRRAAPVAGETIDMAALDAVFMRSERDIIARIGKPAGIYRIGEEQYWLYPNACRLSARERVCAELQIRDGASQQINWLPEAAMRKSVLIAKDLADWRPPLGPIERRFTAEGSDVTGRTRAMVAHKFGQPDVRRIFNGIEVWEYHAVPRSTNDPTPLTLVVEFDGDKVARTLGD